MGKTYSRTKARNPAWTELLQTERNASAPEKFTEQPVLHVFAGNARPNDEEKKERKTCKSDFILTVSQILYISSINAAQEMHRITFFFYLLIPAQPRSISTQVRRELMY